jgi:large subunit ribosomal protein L30
MTDTQATTGGQLKVTLVRSTIGRPADQGRAVQSLGLRKLNSTVILEDTPSIRGAVNKVSRLVTVEEVSAGTE